jgi:hypothetical protein
MPEGNAPETALLASTGIVTVYPRLTALNSFQFRLMQTSEAATSVRFPLARSGRISLAYARSWAGLIRRARRPSPNPWIIEGFVERVRKLGKDGLRSALGRENSGPDTHLIVETGFLRRRHVGQHGQAFTHANIRFMLSGSKLTWSSERGTATYMRCPI